MVWISVGAAALWAAFAWGRLLAAAYERWTFQQPAMCFDCDPATHAELLAMLAFASIAIGQLVTTWRTRRNERSAYVATLLCGLVMPVVWLSDRIDGWQCCRDETMGPLPQFLLVAARNDIAFVGALLAWLVGNAIWLRPRAR